MKDSNFRHRNSTLVCGLEHFIDKIGYGHIVFLKKNIPIKYLVNDTSGFSNYFISKYSADVKILSGGLYKRIIQIIIFFIENRKFKYVDVYDVGLFTLFYGIISKVLMFNLTIVLRGGELNHYPQTFYGNLRRFGLIMSLHISNRVICKEDNLIFDVSMLNSHRLVRKTFFLGNAVPEFHNQYRPFDSRHFDIAFINSVRESRHVDIIVRAVREIVDRGYDNIRVLITGFTKLNSSKYRIRPEYEDYILRLIEELGLRKFIEIREFVLDPSRLHQDTKLFLLPSDVVFANYSLLEAMSHGTVPLVSDREGATRVVDAGITGFILPIDKDAWADAIIEILQNREMWQEMSLMASLKVRTHFSMDSWFNDLMKIRKNS